jgi:hypothetical protein
MLWRASWRIVGAPMGARHVSLPSSLRGQSSTHQRAAVRTGRPEDPRGCPAQPTSRALAAPWRGEANRARARPGVWIRPPRLLVTLAGR